MRAETCKQREMDDWKTARNMGDKCENGERTTILYAVEILLMLSLYIYKKYYKLLWPRIEFDLR